MADQDFEALVAGGLLEEVETIVVGAHRDLYRREGKPWTRPVAYEWLKYEDPAPVERLAQGVRRLRKLGAHFDRTAVEKATRKASESGFLI